MDAGATRGPHRPVPQDHLPVGGKDQRADTGDAQGHDDGAGVGVVIPDHILEERRARARHRMESLYWSNPDVYRAAFIELRLAKKLAGTCLDCSAPALEDNERCKKHRDSNRASHETYRARRRAESRAALIAKKAAERREIRDYVPMDQIVNLPRVRVLRAARRLEWFSQLEMFKLLGGGTESQREVIAQTICRAAKAWLLERRPCSGFAGGGAKWDYRITAAGVADLEAVLSGRNRRVLSGKRAA